MLQYAVRRVLWTIPVLLVCMTLLFALMRVGGGNFLRQPPPAGLSNVAWVKYGDPKPESITRNIERRLGLDLPWYGQYLHYLHSVARLDFGPTFTFTGRSVNSILREQGRSRSSSRCSRSAGRSRSGSPSASRPACAVERCSTVPSRP